MATATYRGVVRGGVVLLDKETPLSDGTEVVEMPVPGSRGTAAAVLAAVAAGPHVPAEWVHELEQLIAEGKVTPARRQRGPLPPAVKAAGTVSDLIDEQRR